MPYNPKIVQVKMVLPEGYYDEHEDVTDEGFLFIQDLLDEAGIELDSVEQ